MEQEPTQDKSDWLLKLEQESWQAELIISGLAIYSSIQLPGLITDFGQWALTYFSHDLGLFLYLIQMYLFLAANFLILGFITHFILRAIWIGLIGLNSVYPNGINPEGGSFSKVYLENFKRDFSFEKRGIEQLDEICSLVFAITTHVLLTSLAIVIDILIVYGLKLLLDLFLPSYLVKIIGVLLFIALLIPSFLMAYFNKEKNKKNDRLQEKAYRFQFLFGKIVMHIFHKPVTFISMVFMSHINLKNYILRVVLLAIPMMGLGLYNLFESKSIFLFSPDILYRQYTYYESVGNTSYEENLREDSDRIFSTVIPSELIEGKMMRIFIPVFRKESNNQLALCGEYENVDSLPRHENRWRKSMFQRACYKKYHKISVNEKVYQKEFVEYTHPHKSAKGILTYIPTDDFKKGRNFLKVEKLTKDTSNVYRTMIVPFWYGGE